MRQDKNGIDMAVFSHTITIWRRKLKKSRKLNAFMEARMRPPGNVYWYARCSSNWRHENLRTLSSSPRRKKKKKKGKKSRRSKIWIKNRTRRKDSGQHTRGYSRSVAALSWCYQWRIAIHASRLPNSCLFIFLFPTVLMYHMSMRKKRCPRKYRITKSLAEKRAKVLRPALHHRNMESVLSTCLSGTSWTNLLQTRRQSY